MKPTIFCPQCRQLILEQPLCSECGWQRPPENDGSRTKLWSVKLDGKLSKPHCYPAVGAGILYISTEGGTLAALELESGVAVWQHLLGDGCVASTLAIHQSQLLVACQDMRAISASGKALLALDVKTAKEIWRYETSAHSLSGPVVANGTICFTTTDGQLHAVDAMKGERQWVVEHSPWGPDAPAIGDDIVCAGGQGGTLSAYAAIDGIKLWSFSAEGWFATRPCIADGCVFALSWHDHLYALDAHSGQLLWTFKDECGEAPTTPPLVADGRVFVGAQVSREISDAQKKVYAVLALDARNGIELWRHYSQDLIFAPLAVAEGVLFFGLNDGSLYAVDATSGEMRWQMQGQARIVTEPQVVGGIVCFGERDGTLHAVRWKAKPAEFLAPTVYEQRGEFSLAAAAYALQGEFEKAAVLCQRQLGLYQEAAQLYEQAGLPGHAAPLWEELGAMERARDLYRKTGNQAAQARVLETMGKPLEAAQLYQAIGQLAKAQAIWKSQGEWERLAESLVAEGKLAEAASTFERQGRLEKAAGLYEEAEQLEQALRLRVRLQDWGNTAQLANRLGNYVQKAVAFGHLGHDKLAAEAYEQAAQQAVDARPRDEEHVATLYEQAAELYNQVLDGRNALACWRQVQRYRHLPEVQVHGEAQDMFVEYEWSTLELRVENTGFGPARNIRIGLRGKFDARGKRQIHALLPQQARILELFIRPRKHQVGPKVPLEVVVTYKDSQDNLYRVNQFIAVGVTGKDDLRGQAIPLRVHIQGDLVHPGTKTQEGDIRARETDPDQPIDPATIRALLLVAFTADDLRRLFLYTSNRVFRPLLHEFGPGDSLASLIDATITYCEKRGLLPDLLREVEEANPNQYARFMSAQEISTDSPVHGLEDPQ